VAQVNHAYRRVTLGQTTGRDTHYGDRCPVAIANSLLVLLNRSQSHCLSHCMHASLSVSV